MDKMTAAKAEASLQNLLALVEELRQQGCHIAAYDMVVIAGHLQRWLAKNAPPLEVHVGDAL